MTDPDDPDLLAAEYVLGTADAAERALAASRLAAGDAALARAVRAWEERLGPLVEAVPAVEPPPELRAAVARRLFGPEAAAAGSRGRDGAAALRRQVRIWRGAAAAASALAAALALYVALGGPAPGRAERLVAVLRRDPDSPAVVLDVDLGARRLTVRPFDAAAPAGRAYELWIIDPALGAPHSLGLVPARAGAGGSLGAYSPAVIAGATYAVTVEPPGGSPTGRPTAAPVLSGKLSPPPP